jgi:hypothetical protein
MRKFLSTALVTGVASIAAVVPASAAPEQNGLVNLNVEDVTVQVPIAVAANVCGVDVTVIALAFAPTGKQTFVDCESDAVSVAERRPSR